MLYPSFILSSVHKGGCSNVGNFGPGNFGLVFFLKNASWYKFIKYTYHNQTDLLYTLKVFKIQFENKSQDVWAISRRR